MFPKTTKAQDKTIIKKFEDLGYKYDSYTTAQFRKEVDLKWLRNSLMVFRK